MGTVETQEGAAMKTGAAFDEVVGELRAALVRAQRDATYQQEVGARDQVLAAYGPVFQPESVRELTEAQLRAFLRYEGNQHWSGLQRAGARLCSDMDALHEGLYTLVDESSPIAQRYTTALQSVHGLGKAVATGILLVAYPAKYGPWNSTSEAALRQLGAWPELAHGATVGESYARVNETLLALAQALDLDLWSLDALLWYYLNKIEDDGSKTVGVVEPAQGFGLERHLRDFLRDNWGATELGRDYELHTEEGDPDAGYEYPTDVGRIDLLARSKSDGAWLVIELKRGQTSDATVGQVLRYMGWIAKHRAAPGEKVRGMIIAHEADSMLQYALAAVPDVSLKLYEVHFELRQPAAGAWSRDE